MVLLLGAAVAAQMGVVTKRGRLGIENPIYRKTVDKVSRAEYVASLGLYLPKGEFAKAAGAFLGGLRSDAYWLKAAQYVSKAFRDPALKSRFLGDLYLAMIDADPYWSTAAETAANIVDAVSRKHEQALAIIDRALRERPDQWRLWYTKAAIYMFWPGHEKEAASAALMGARQPGASKVLMDLASRLGSESGDLDFAERVTLERLERYGTDTSLGKIALRDLVEYRARRLQALIQQALCKYRAEKGAFPEKLEDLAAERFIESIPKEPYGLSWLYDPAQGTVLSEGIGILDGLQMRATLLGWVNAYRQRFGGYPARLEDVMAVARASKTDNETRRLFGAPPVFRKHPVLGDWPYDSSTGRITLPPGYTAPDIYGRVESMLSTSPTM